MIELCWKYFEIGVNLWESFLIMHFIFCFLDTAPFAKENRRRYIGGSFFYFAMITIMNHVIAYEGVLSLLYVVGVFLYTLFFLRGKWQRKLLGSILYLLCIMLISSTVTSLISFLADIPLEAIYTTISVNRFLAIVIVQILLVYCYQMILAIFHKGEMSFRKSEWMVIICVLILSFFVMLCIHLVRMSMDLSSTAAEKLIVADVCIIAMNLVVLYLVSHLHKRNAEMQRLENERQELQYQASYVKSIQQQSDSLKQMRHDWKQHLCVVQVMLAENRIEEAQKYLQTYQKEGLPAVSYVHLQNPYLNALLNLKFGIAKEKRIDIEFKCQAEFQGYSDVHLCNLIGNLMDNAIEACQDVEISKRRLQLSIAGNAERLLIGVVNATAYPVKKNNPLLQTSKLQKEQHGFGMQTIRSIVKHYQGDIDCYDSDGMFHTQIILYGV